MDFALESYIRNHIDQEPAHLRHLDRLTNLRLINGRMCSGHIQGRLLKMLVEMINPKRALELGTFSGYSALCIAEGMAEDGQLHTFEIDDELEDFIRDAFAASPHGKKITLHIGDASQEIAKWDKESLDLIFIDADKREYCDYYRLCLPLLMKGGYIIADNTLWD
ncbi:MAG: class I SAM-dependent methyltransferase, partial [Muribaculaceae bacterium]|nr:class I SAM-dependent methyltransferase [Muribaculaceae bacterium]